MTKILYTTYIALFFFLTLIPLWLAALVLPRKIVAPLCKAWARLNFFMAGCPLSRSGTEYLKQNQPVIYTPNHASYLDSLLLMAILPSNTRFVGKQELLTTPILRTFMAKLGYLAVDRMEYTRGIEDTKAIDNLIRAGNSIVIFPEGTFSYAAGLRPFKSGAFKVAIDTHTALLPIAIQGTRQILRGDERLLKPGKIHLTFCEPVVPQGNDWQELTRLKTQVREDIAKHCGEPTLDMILAGPSMMPDEIHKKGNKIE